MENPTNLPVSAIGLESILQQFIDQEDGSEDQFRILDFMPLEQTTSFPCFVLSVEITEGKRFKLFLKDYSTSRLPKASLAERIEREVRVYQELLMTANLGTPVYYGAEQGGQKGHGWLLLEYVQSVELRSCGFDAYLHAAAWLGKLHAYFHFHSQKLDGADYLEVHERNFFASKAQSALQAMSEYGSHISVRLKKILEGYDDIIQRMISQNHTLVHGSFRPQNILLMEGEPDWRVCPIDWELAGLGSQFFDLAFLVDGYQSTRLEMLLDTYNQSLSHRGMPVSDPRALLTAINCFRLHKMLKSLSDSLSMKFPYNTVNKILTQAEKIRSDIVL